MSDIIPIKPNRQKLENAKLAVQKIADKTPQTPTLSTFRHGKSWYGVTHKVTGEDMNVFVSDIQSLIFQLNKENIDTYKQFTAVYNFFDILDKEYIKYFNLSIDKLEVVTEEARKAGNDALNAQKEITRTIQVLKLTIEKLTKNKIETDNKLVSFENDIKAKLTQLNRIDELKRDLESNKHFSDVDTIWADVQTHKANISSIEERLSKGLIDISLLKDYKSKLEGLKYLSDVDTIWTDVQTHKTNIIGIEERLSKGLIDISLLKDYKSKLEGLKYLSDVDTIWADVQTHKANISSIEERLSKGLIDISLLK
ncbi:hypothetical protein, partial [Myroides sp. LoEW2-1]|uniref:hypothetical protein n=1 Tax=Myroides sp. LoEW2-1 TaxID=2683192 RepID=UPI00132A166D